MKAFFIYIIFQYSIHLWHEQWALSQVWWHSQRSVVPYRHGHSHDFQGIKLPLRHSLCNTLQTNDINVFFFFFGIAVFAWNEIEKKKCHTYQDQAVPSPPWTILARALVFLKERKKIYIYIVCACAFVCSVSFELRGLSWGALFFQTFGLLCMCVVHVPRFAVDMGIIRWLLLKLMVAEFRIAIPYDVARKSNTFYIFGDVCTLYCTFFFLFLFTPRHRSHSAWIHLVHKSYAYLWWKK